MSTAGTGQVLQAMNQLSESLQRQQRLNLAGELRDIDDERQKVALEARVLHQRAMLEESKRRTEVAQQAEAGRRATALQDLFFKGREEGRKTAMAPLEKALTRARTSFNNAQTAFKLNQLTIASQQEARDNAQHQADMAQTNSEILLAALDKIQPLLAKGDTDAAIGLSRELALTHRADPGLSKALLTLGSLPVDVSPEARISKATSDMLADDTNLAGRLGILGRVAGAFGRLKGRGDDASTLNPLEALIADMARGDGKGRTGAIDAMGAAGIAGKEDKTPSEVNQLGEFIAKQLRVTTGLLVGDRLQEERFSQEGVRLSQSGLEPRWQEILAEPLGKIARLTSREARLRLARKLKLPDNAPPNVIAYLETALKRLIGTQGG